MNEKLTVTFESAKKGFKGGCTLSENGNPVENSWVLRAWEEESRVCQGRKR